MQAVSRFRISGWTGDPAFVGLDAMKMSAFAKIVLLAQLLPTLVSAQVQPKFAKDVADSKDHPALKRIEGSVILHYSAKKFDSLQIAQQKIAFDYSAQKITDWKKITAEGARTTLFYREPKDAGTLECLRSYQNDLKAAGFEVLFEGSSAGKPTDDSNTLDNGYGRFIKAVYQSETDYDIQQYTMPGADDYRYTALRKTGENGAGDVYVTVFCAAVTASWKAPEKGILEGTVLARVDVLETKAMNNRMVLVKADEMEKQINATGRVALYGIYFDFNKATLQPESAETLKEVENLLKADSGLRLLVVGHTDNVGGFDSNKSLSERRAAAVVEELQKNHGIASQRLFPFGCGFACPAAPNTTDDGRAKNRRVELVRW